MDAKAKTPLNSSRKRGSALLIAMIFSSILAVIAVPTYLRLSYNTVALSNRTHYNIAAINLAESGIEYTVHTIKEAANDQSIWDDWTVDGDDAHITLDSFNYVGDIVGTLSIYVIGYQADAPEVLSKSTIELTNQADIQKYMYAQISSSSSRGLFAYGVLTKEFIQASGGVVFNSWISDPDNDPDTAFQFYDSSVARDEVAIATVATETGAIELGSSDVYGTAAVGSDHNLGLTMDWGGQVGPGDPNEWDPLDSEHLELKDPAGWKVSLETGALTTGFTAGFEDITTPELEVSDLRYEYRLPFTDRQQKGNEWATWYENVYVNSDSLGEPGETTTLELDSLVINGDAVLRIEGDVTIHLPAEGKTTLQVIEGGKIELAPDATLTIYTAGDTKVTGGGIFSEVAPEQFQIWGTATESQKINFLQNGQFSGLIYAPNAEVKITGDSDLYGSIVCKNITLTGSGSFRYDESLVDYTGGTTSPGPPEVTFMEELSGNERAAYLAHFDF